MPDLADGASLEVQGSARSPYIVKNIAGVYSCSCPAWRNQSLPIDRRSCKHIRSLRGAAAEQSRLGTGAVPAPIPVAQKASGGPPLLLAQAWDTAQDLSGWWISEKLDGVRAYWDGSRFQSRQGNVFHAPPWFTQQLPPTSLDGELWMARKSFQRTVSIVRRQDAGPLWREIRYVVFDAPHLSEPFEQRQQELQRLLGDSQNPFASVIDHQPCENAEHLRQELARVEALGGEGLMLRQPGSRYAAGRSPTLLKVKSFHDAEATVLEHLPGAGRHRGRMGALLVVLPNGTQFSVGTGFTDPQRGQPPAVGSVITFRYQELTDGGVPRFPSFVRVRTDTPVGTLPLR